MDQGAIEWAMDVTSGEIEGAMDQGANDWVMDVTSGETEGAMDQGAILNRKEQNYVALIFMSKNDTIER